MEQRRSFDDEVQQLVEVCAQLRAQLAQQNQHIEVLRTELAETNQGVVVLYAELDSQAHALQAATEVKSRFLSYMSHEFRTPLGSIRSIARILLNRMDGPLTAEQEKQIEFIRVAAVELTDMVNDLLDLAKIEAGRVSISPEWFEMVELFAALRGIFKPLATNPEVALVLEEPRELMRVYTDHKKLSQILRNFISNALKFTARGEVRVSVQELPAAQIRFSVADTGIGIAQEFQEAIFHDFVQIDSSLQQNLGGTGLGLALSKKIAELLGGRVDLTSEVNVGSTFSVTIPMCLNDASLANPEAGNSPGAEKGTHGT